jgi:general stress protein 26
MPQDAVSRAQEKVDTLWRLVRRVRIAMLVTQDAEGDLRARPMANQQADTFDGALWFFTAENSAKVDEAERDRRVNLAFADASDQTYVSISGTAEIVRDRAEIDRRWSERLTTWFPKGKDDPNLALIKVTAHKGEYWDRPSSAMVLAYGIVKATLTGIPPDPGDHGKVRL